MLNEKAVKKRLNVQANSIHSLSRVPPKLLLGRTDSGIFFGDHDATGFVGMPEGEDGNVLVVGGNGSGKTAGIIKPTLETWRGTIFALDIKGCLSSWYHHHYTEACSCGETPRPYLIFDPMNEDGIGYDPFAPLEQGGEEMLVSNVWDLAYSLIPENPEVREPFWLESERAILAAGLLHYYKLGLSFTEAITEILAKPVINFCEELRANGNAAIRILIGSTPDLKDETVASIDRGLRNHLLLFATDPYIVNFMSGKREDADCFFWDYLSEFNIFVKLPLNKLEAWGPAVRLMLTQLVRHLEQRPEKYDVAGADLIQTLLLLDEFPRIGKVQCMTSALSTLRSKSVNFCLVVQSLAQLDAIYGKEQRKIIADNCQFQAVLRANDAETQRLLANLIGTALTCRCSMSATYDAFNRPQGYSYQVSETRDYLVQPHEMETLKDILLITPYGTCRVEKFRHHCLLHEAESGECNAMIRDWINKFKEGHKQC